MSFSLIAWMIVSFLAGWMGGWWRHEYIIGRNNESLAAAQLLASRLDAELKLRNQGTSATGNV